MPSKSKKQHNLMAMVAHDPAAAKRLGIPQSVGKEYVTADKGKKFREGGVMKESKEMMKKEISFMKKKGAPKSMIKHEESEAKEMCGGGKAMATGGMAGCKTIAKKEVKAHEKRMHGSKMANGGYVRAADGVAQRGKTKGKMV